MIDCVKCGMVCDSIEAYAEHLLESHEHPWRNGDVLEQLFIDREVKRYVIADLFDVTPHTIYRNFKKNGVSKDRPWRDKEVFREKYVEQNMDQKDMAEEWDCHPTNIERWVKRHGLKKKHRNPEWLEEKYYGEGLTLKEMADLANTTETSVWRFMKKHDIKRRGKSDKPASFYTTEKGYEVWACGNYGDYVKVHRLLAVAEYGFEALNGNVVHHKNKTPWDNRAANVEVMDPVEHTKHHHEEGDMVG